ncbi:MAG TPA: SURF1 family protein [Acidimicrobiia bacterium]|nr:SURF1 family protein [Acidimicrobiia bacterium]
MRWLLSPRWVVAHIVVLALAVVFVNLGFWQLRRLDERRLTNQVGESRYAATPVDLAELLSAAGDDVESLEYRRATATGVFQPDQEILVRSQVYQGAAGFHVITPLLGESGSAVLVNRGWVPLGLDTVPVVEAPPPEGEVTVTGWVRPTQERMSLGPTDPEDGRLVALNRVDIDRIEEQVPFELAPVYLSQLGDQEPDRPLLVSAPTFDDEGPHLAYAVQWFGFMVIGVVGYLMLIRRVSRRSG